MAINKEYIKDGCDALLDCIEDKLTELVNDGFIPLLSDTDTDDCMETIVEFDRCVKIALIKKLVEGLE